MAATTTNMSASTSSPPSSPLPLTVSRMCVRVAAFFVLPEALLQFDAQQDQLELVLKPYAKYYYEHQRATIIELPEHVLAFTSDAIVQRFGVLDLDLDAVAAAANDAASGRDASNGDSNNYSNDNNNNNMARMAGDGGGSSSSSCGGGVAGNKAGDMHTRDDKDNNNSNCSNSLLTVTTMATATATDNNNSSNSSCTLGAAYSIDNNDGSRNTTNRSVAGAARDVADDKGAGDTSSAPGNVTTTAAGTATGTATPQHVFDIYFPSRADLKVIVQVFTALRHRRVSCASTRWLSPPPRMGRAQNNMASFAVAMGEVQRHKMVNRMVGMTVGRLLCCVQLPGIDDDLRRVPHASMRIIAEANLLHQDSVRLCKRAQEQHNERAAAAAARQADTSGKSHDSGTTPRGAAYASPSPPSASSPSSPSSPSSSLSPVPVAELRDRLLRGETVLSVYTSLLLHYDPQHFARRVQRLFDMYPISDQGAMAAWAHVTVAGLLSKYATRLHELMWKLCMKIGPEYGSVSPRVRYMVYRWYHKFTDEEAAAVVAAAGPNDANLLDYEPDGYMQILVEHFGPELLPTRYNFSPIECSTLVGVPMLFLQALHYPASSSSSSSSAATGATTGATTTMERHGMHSYNDGDDTAAAVGVRSAMRQRSPQPPPPPPPPLLQVTPNERPLCMPQQRGGSSSNNNTSGGANKVNEIDLLLEKYRGEFNYLVPPIVDAMDAVVRSHETAILAGTSPAIAVVEAVEEAVAAAAATSSSSSSTTSLPLASSSRIADNNSGSGSSSATAGTATAAASAAVAAAEAVMDTVSTTSAVCELMRVFYSRNARSAYTVILQRLATCTFISPSSLLTGLIYLDRLCMCVPMVPLTHNFVEKLLVTAVRVASKVVDLRSVNNKNFASVFSLPTANLNAMEEALLKLLGFNCFVAPEEFYAYARRLMPPSPQPQLQPRQQQPSAPRRAQAAAMPTALVAAEPAAVAQQQHQQQHFSSSGSVVAVAARGGGGAAYPSFPSQPQSATGAAYGERTRGGNDNNNNRSSSSSSGGVVAVAAHASHVTAMASAPAASEYEREALVQTRLATAGSIAASTYNTHHTVTSSGSTTAANNNNNHSSSSGGAVASPRAWQPAPPAAVRPAYAHAPRGSFASSGVPAPPPQTTSAHTTTTAAAAAGGGVVRSATASTSCAAATTSSPRRGGSGGVVVEMDVEANSSMSNSHNYNANHHSRLGQGGAGDGNTIAYTSTVATNAAAVAAVTTSAADYSSTSVNHTTTRMPNAASPGRASAGNNNNSSSSSSSTTTATTTTTTATSSSNNSNSAAAAACVMGAAGAGGAVVYADKVPVSSVVRQHASPHGTLAHVY